MRLTNVFLIASVLFFVGKAWSHGMGISSYPIETDKKIVSAEFTSTFSDGSGVGLQARYTQKMNSNLVLDGGFGVASGERSGSFFVGADYEIYPDYMKQPKVTLKTTYTNSQEFDTRRNIFSMTPTISKGFTFWGREGYPYLALPISLGLHGESKTYETMVNAALGINGPVPLKGYRHLTANVELSVDIKDSYTGIFAGISYPLM